jgi:hypothetical protein
VERLRVGGVGVTRRSRSIELHEPDGGKLKVTVLSAGRRAGLPSATFELDSKAWERVESDGLLHADPSRGRSAGRPFDPAKHVEIEAVLDPIAAVDGADALLDRLLHAKKGDPLLSTEAWWALSATQEVELPSELASTGALHEGIAYEHPVWLQDAGGSVGLEEAWERAMDLAERLEQESAEPLLEVVATMFRDADWHVERPNPDATVLLAPVRSESGALDLYVSTDEQRHTMTIFAVLDTAIPSERMTSVLELAALLNGKLAVGSFEPSLEGGLSFKVGIDVTGDHLTTALARNLVGGALISGERALPLLRAVLAGERSAADAALLFEV